MRVLKNLLGSDTKIDINTIAKLMGTTPALLSELVIEEYGSNSNGNYTRFGNGMQICTFRKKYTELSITNAAGNLYRSDTQKIFYPAHFKEGVKPGVVPFLSGSTTAFFGAPNSEPGHDGFAFYVMRPASDTKNIIVTGIASGLYK